MALTLFVDDLVIQHVSTRRHILTHLPKALDDLHVALESVGVRVSKGEAWHVGGKTVAHVTDLHLAASFEAPLRFRGIAVVRAARNLGLDFDPFGRSGRAVQVARWRSSA